MPKDNNSTYSGKESGNNSLQHSNDKNVHFTLNTSSTKPIDITRMTGGSSTSNNNQR